MPGAAARLAAPAAYPCPLRRALADDLPPPPVPVMVPAAQRRELAAGLRKQGLSWRQVGERLGCFESWAYRLGHGTR